MAPQPGTTNNPKGGKPDKLIRDALLAAHRQDPDRLKRVAEKMWQLSEEGDKTAFKEIADRIDGKAVQPIAGSLDDDPIQILQRIERVVVDPNDI